MATREILQSTTIVLQALGKRHTGNKRQEVCESCRRYRVKAVWAAPLALMLFLGACGNEEFLPIPSEETGVGNAAELELAATTDAVEITSDEEIKNLDMSFVIPNRDLPVLTVLRVSRLEAFVITPWNAQTRQATIGLRWISSSRQPSGTLNFVELRRNGTWQQLGNGLPISTQGSTHTISEPGAGTAPIFEFRVRTQWNSSIDISATASVLSSLQYPQGHIFTAPTNLVYEGDYSGRALRLVWNDREVNEPNEIRYQIECDLSSDGRFVELARVTANHNSYIFPPAFRLPGASTTRFRVRSIPTGTAATSGRYGSSAYANTQFTTAWSTAVAAPQNLIGTSQRPTALTISWTENANVQSRNLIWVAGDGQLFTVIEHEGPPPAQNNSSPRRVEREVTGLSPGTLYTFFVQQVDSAGFTSMPSQRISMATCHSQPPTAPTNLQATVLYDSQQNTHWARLTWTNTSQMDGFEVLQTTGQHNEVAMGVSSLADATTSIIGPLVPGVRFAYRVRAVRCNVVSEFRLPSPSNTAEVLVPGIPPASVLEINNKGIPVVDGGMRFDISDIRINGVLRNVNLENGMVSDVIPGGQSGTIAGLTEGTHAISYRHSFFNFVTNSRQRLPGMVTRSFTKEVYGREVLFDQAQPTLHELLRQVNDTQLYSGSGNASNGALMHRRISFSRLHPNFPPPNEYGRLADQNNLPFAEGPVRHATGSTLTARKFTIGNLNIVFTLDLAYGCVSIPTSAHGPMLLFPQ